jgi:phosphopentomutase/2,3-bisphosphoglycerate-independent phosphoglycerate mutase family metalloenzyme
LRIRFDAAERKAAFPKGMHMRVTPLVLLALPVACSALAAQAQTPRRTENVVLIVSDGLRWQELFRGADPALVNQRYGGVDDSASVYREFVRSAPAQARQALFPFLWTTVAAHGQIFGDADSGSVATVTNGLKFSYPGYNEMISGRADPRIDRNDAGPNPNVTVFEWLAHQPAFRSNVAVFGTWDAFAPIFNRERSGLPIRAGWDVPFTDRMTPAESTINRLYATTTRLWGDELAYDGFMQAAVLDYVRTRHPRVLFVGYGETDEWAHSRRYDQTLRSAHRVDAFIGELWRTMQSLPQYKDRTTFIITADHGRGSGPNDWTDHGKNVAGAENIWIAVMGPDTRAAGERVRSAPVTQSQIAATIAALLGTDYHAAVPEAAPPIADVLPGAAAR